MEVNIDLSNKRIEETQHPRKKRSRRKEKELDGSNGISEGWGCESLPVVVEIHTRGRQRGRPRKRGNFTCTACSFQALDINSLSEHVSALHSNMKLHVCPNCGATFTQKGNLVVHMRIHESVRPYACDQCDFTAVQKNNLYNHQRTHTKEKPYVCSECNYRAAQMGTLRGHYERRHGVAASMPKGSYVNPLFQCTHCTFVCPKQKDMKAHLEAYHSQHASKTSIHQPDVNSHDYRPEHTLHIKQEDNLHQ